MEKQLSFDRADERQKAVLASEQSDLKQHADKMLRDFEKFNDFSSNRAIWELIQNACDLTVNCHVTIDYQKKQFSFTHNGRPFNCNSLVSLIKQVSGDKDEHSAIPPVGKYGTGFLTTHSLGRKFIINSILETSSGYFLEIKDFAIDRRPKRWEDLAENIRRQKEAAFELIDRTGKVIEQPSFSTTFTYLPETEQEHTYVTESFRDLEEYIPFVLTINQRLKIVRIIDQNGKEVQFTVSSKENVVNDKEINLFKTCIQKDGVERVIYSITDPENEIEIILPIDKEQCAYELPERVARLFLYYPLIGTQSFGMNFIINCNKFLPTEPRDGIHLSSNKDQVKDQEVLNRHLLDRASKLLFRFLTSNVLPVKNPFLYANINFKRDSDNLLLNTYFTELQETWVNTFKDLEIVETKAGYKKISDITLVRPELVSESDNFDCIYYLFDKFYDSVPSKQTIKEWCKFVDKWKLSTVVFIDNKAIATQIEKKSLNDFDKELLIKYYKHLLTCQETGLFTAHSLLPNIYGDFRLLGTLREAKDLDNLLIQLGKELAPDAVSHLVHKDFVFEIKFDPFNRKSLSNQINSNISEKLQSTSICLPENYIPGEYHTEIETHKGTLPNTFFLAALHYCKLHHNTASRSKPTLLMGIISTYYNESPDLLAIEPIENREEDIDVRPAQKNVAKVFFNTLAMHNSDWVRRHIQLFYDIALSNEDRFKEIYATSKLYPNQQNQLCLLSELKKGLNLEQYIIELYNKTASKDIEASIAILNFNEFLVENEIETNKTLATRIEDTFFQTDIRDINDHPFKEEIITLIKKLSSPYYQELFPRLNDKKAHLMLDVVNNDNIKDDLFSIFTLKEEQLKKLGKVVQHPDFEKVLTEATKAIEQEKQRKSDFEHKKKIGNYIEDQIRGALNAEIREKIVIDKEPINADNVQGGQDIIIYYQEIPIYFLEVKSRWDSGNSVFLSKLQLERAALNPNRFALISVDITKYTGLDNRYALPFDEILPLTKVVESISEKVQPLINNNLAAEKDDTSAITLVDYRGRVNQDIIKIGLDFKPFISKLIDLILSVVYPKDKQEH